MGVVGGGIGAVLLALLALALGVDPSGLVQTTGPTPMATAAEDSAAQFASVVLADTEEVWQEIFARELGQAYDVPTLILFSGAVQSACGYAQAAVGPFYCPVDGNVYIDLAFFEELQERLGAPGDFARAYVIAHEVGHHVQNLLGLSEAVRSQQARLSAPEGNALSVRLELQADCFAGVWANQAEARWRILEPGDVEEALGAASAVGDDQLQLRARGYVVPESFTHGTSAERVSWFERGFRTGDPAACDTFSGAL